MSTVVGAVFAVIVMSSAVTYTGVSMNQITELAQEIETKQIVDVEKTTESYDILGLRTDNGQFNMTVINTGDLPVHIVRLWVENTTDSSVYPISKYELDLTIPSGGDIDDIGQGLNLFVDDTASYMLMLVTERGNTQKMFVNGLGDADSSVYLNLRATPSLVPAGFSSSIILEVINTGTNKLLNLVPEMDPPVVSCTTTCAATLISGPTPTNATSLDPGNMAIFEWVYTLEGEDSGADYATFTASLANGLDEVTTTLSLQPVAEAENADVALESGGVVGDPLISDGILIFHMEQENVPSPGYQMMSSSVEGGVNGLLVNMETKTAGNPFSVFTNNGSSTITVPAGKWNASLALRSEPVPTGLKDQNEDMIFHFEDGDGIPPDNSVGQGDRDLTNCGLTTFQERITQSTNDAEQDAGGSNDVWGSSSDFELVYDGNHQYIGLRWSLDVPSGATITSADIRFRSDETQTGTSPSLTIGAQDIDDAAQFANISHNVDDRWDGTVSSVTSATVPWNGINGWSGGEEGTDTTTPDLSAIIQEIVDRPGWASGQNIVIMIKTASGDNFGKRTAEHYDAGGPGQAARLTVVYGTTGTPDWQGGSGPHGSGAYYYDGASMCHRSTYNVSDANGNDIQNNNVSTSLWFRTDGVDQVSSEQMLVFWEGGGAYPNSDYYKISLGEDGTGRILFEFNMDLGGSHTSTCRSVNEYDDGNWYNVVAVKTFTEDRCDLYITDTMGVDTETPLTHSPNHGSSSVDVDGRWYVGSMEQRAYYFQGWIDDILHWNDDALTADEAEDLSITNFGDGAHQLDISLNVTDSNGVVTGNIYAEKGVLIPFVDSKGFSDSTDSAYTMTNVTMILPQVNVTALERLNYTMSFTPSTATWEALELDMKIDDVGFITPYPSYLQLPEPDNPFPSYVVYDNDDEMELFVNNTGDDGIYFVFPGTRLSFYSETLGSYASLVRYVNGTSASYAVDVDKDSIYIPTNESAQIIFFAHPSNHPCAGSNCQNADFIPPGTYSMAAWVNGYSDQGETFGRTVQLGTVTVQE